MSYVASVMKEKRPQDLDLGPSDMRVDTSISVSIQELWVFMEPGRH